MAGLFQRKASGYRGNCVRVLFVIVYCFRVRDSSGECFLIFFTVRLWIVMEVYLEGPQDHWWDRSIPTVQKCVGFTFCWVPSMQRMHFRMNEVRSKVLEQCLQLYGIPIHAWEYISPMTVQTKRRTCPCTASVVTTFRKGYLEGLTSFCQFCKKPRCPQVSNRRPYP